MARPTPLQIQLAQKYGRQYGVDPKLLLAIAGHETEWGTTGAGRPSQGSFALGYGVTDSGILGKYHGLQNQYRYAASTLSDWGAKTLADVLAGKASRYATDPGWEQGVRSVYGSLGGRLPPMPAPTAPTARPPRRPGTTPTTSKLIPGAGFGPSTIRQFDPSALAQGIFSGLLTGEQPNVAALTAQSYKTVQLPGYHLPGKRQPAGKGPPPKSDASPPPDKAVAAVTPKNVSKWAIAGKGMDRGGVRTNPAVFQSVARIAQIYGKPLTIGTGSNHREFVNNDPSGHRSDHWFGEAADIPMTGAALTRLGQDALIMAGMSPAEARKQKGGVFNVGGYNILFNTTVGGNHYNHLHIGLGRIIGRPA
jgi:Mannosyl-glycoprotein endo-beta-N-acetylglucosaminidase